MQYTDQIIGSLYCIKAIPIENIKSTCKNKRPQQKLVGACLKYAAACFTTYFLFFL